LKLATKTRKQLLGEEVVGTGEELVRSKKSAYNGDLYVDECAICGKKNGLDVHHISSQKYADCNDTIDYYHKNHKANLVVLCESHHKDVHNGVILVRGWMDTVLGRKLDWSKEEVVDEKVVKVHVRGKREGGISEEMRERVREYRYLLKNLSLRVLKAKIEKELGIVLSPQQIRGVFNEV